MELKIEGLWGQEHALGMLSHALKSGKVASAYLFAGPHGTGKTAAARAFAQALLCAGTDDVPCGQCRPCKMFASRNHPDFINVYVDDGRVRILPDLASELDAAKAKALRVDEMRLIMEALSYKSYMGGRKVLVIEEADIILPRAAANAFLKTLEEPPAETIIILTAASPASLLQTIVSRCRQVRFMPMPPEQLAPLLEERLSVLPAEALRLAQLAEGCPGAALGGDLDRVKEIASSAGEIMAMLPDLSAEAVIRFAEGWKERRVDLPLLLDRMLELLRMAQHATLGVSCSTNSDIVSVYKGIPDERIMEAFDAVLAARPRLVLNPNVPLFLESLLFNLQSILNNGYAIASTTD